MKTFFPLLTLAVLVVACNSAFLSDGSRLNVGGVRPGDALLQTRLVSVPARPNTIQTQDFVYRGRARTNITAIQALQVGWNQYANAYIISGGIGRNNVTIRLQSARGYGYNFTVSVWGRY